MADLLVTLTEFFCFIDLRNDCTYCSVRENICRKKRHYFMPAPAYYNRCNVTSMKAPPIMSGINVIPL